MMVFNKFFKIIKDIYSALKKDIGIKVAFAVSILFVTCLILLNLLVVERSRTAFIEVVKDIRYEQLNINYSIVFPRDAGQEGNLLGYDLRGRERPKPLQEIFTEEFQKSILWIGLLAILTSLLIGFFVAYIFSRPLTKLRTAISRLRENDYRVTLDPIGTEEYDDVVNEFNNLTSELRVADNLRKDLISDTSHELKTPLTSLTAQLEALRDGVIDFTPDRVDTLISQTNRLSNLVNELQEYSSLRNKTYNLKTTKLNLEKLITSTISEFDEQLKSEKININVNIDKDIFIETDAYLFERIFHNLITNTLRYAKAKNIHIFAEKDSIIYSDDGIGISEEHIKLIFERFYRVEKSRNRKTGGLGLGLSIVKEITEAHNWKISANYSDHLLTFKISEVKFIT